VPEPPHPLARELAARLLGRPPNRRRTLLIGLGSGRNVPPLAEAGADLAIANGYEELPPALGGGFDAALSTHAFLHGTSDAVSSGLARLAGVLAPGAPCYLTLGSNADPRFGRGVRLDAGSWAPSEGPEAGIAHAYFTLEQARAALASFGSAEIAEGRAAAGAWAHAPEEIGRTVHWFVRAVAR
jgi:hypothetical protein